MIGINEGNPDKHLRRDALLITVFIFIVYWLLHILYLNLHFLDHDSQVREDSDLNDLVYSKLGGVEPAEKKNQEIFIVNISNANREQIAQMIDSITARDPKVIGLDITFSAEKDSFNRHLQTTLKKNKDKLVMGGYFTYDDKSELGEFIKSDSVYNQGALYGYSNFVTSFSQGTVRRFTPFVKDKTEDVPSFGAAILQKASPMSYDILKNRHNTSEIINYKYALSNFLILEKEEVLSNDYALDLKGKIVLLGLINLKKDAHSFEDYHFTPLNENGNFPDMPGTIIHANIVSMLLSGNYINTLSGWFTLVLSFILCFIHVRWFLWSFVKKHIWFHLYFKVIQFISLVFIVLVSILCYKYYNLRIETSVIAVPIVLAVDVLYFSEAIARWLNLKFNISSYFLGAPHH